MSGKNFIVNMEKNVAVITINRPERRNAFSQELWDDFDAVISGLWDDIPRAVVIAGAGGKSFCAGFDVNPDNPQVSSLADAVNEHNKEPIVKLIDYIRGIVDRFVSLPVPIIAAINGIAYGGGAELAVRCDLRIADPEAVICFSEVKLGLMPDWGGGPALTRLVGPSIACDMVLTGRKVSADEALKLGLVNRVSRPGCTLDEAVNLAREIAKNGPRAVRYALEVIRRSLDMPLKESLNLEKENAVELIASGECVHGIAAFLSKKDPEFPDI